MVTCQSKKIKVGATDEVFQDQWYLWERGASVGVDFDLSNFQDLLQEQAYLTHARRVKIKKKKKH